MIDIVLQFLQSQLDSYLKSFGGDIPTEAMVVFPDEAQSDTTVFKKNAVTLLLINLEEETTLRDADPYRQVNQNGRTEKINPHIHFNLYILLAANNNTYPGSLKNLSRIIRYFQIHRVITQESIPDLDDNIDKLICELITLPFAEQNEVWSALRVAYLPSVIYKVKMVIFTDTDAEDVIDVDEVKIGIHER